MTISTRLTERLGISATIVLAPMDLVSGGALAAAVSAAGGLGLIGGGYGDEAWLTRELNAANDTRVGVGFITWSMAKNPRLLDLALERRPPAIMLSFGDIEPHAGKIKAAGAQLICQVQTLEQARDVAARGADILVAQGAEAGGHGISRATFPFVPAVVDAFPAIPVVAAGGIADGRGLAAALMLGADGVIMGTRFSPPRKHPPAPPPSSTSLPPPATAPSALSCSTSPAATSGPPPTPAASCATNPPSAGEAGKPSCCRTRTSKPPATPKPAKPATTAPPPSSPARPSTSSPTSRPPPTSSNAPSAKPHPCWRSPPTATASADPPLPSPAHCSHINTPLKRGAAKR